MRIVKAVLCLAVVAGLVAFVAPACTRDSRVAALNASADVADVGIAQVEAKYLEDQLACDRSLEVEACVDAVREDYAPVFEAHRVFAAAWVGLAAATKNADGPMLQAAAVDLIEAQGAFAAAAERVGVIGKDGGK